MATKRRQVPLDLAAACQSVSPKINFKSAYFFSIQALTALCEPTGGSFGLNAIAALSQDVLPKLMPALVKFCNDDQVPRSILRIVDSMAWQLAQDGRQEEIDTFMDGKGYEGTVEWIKLVDSASCEAATLTLALEIIGHIQSIVPDLDTSELAPSLLAKIKPKLPISITSHILELSVKACQSAEGVAAVGKSGGTTSLLTYISGVHETKGATPAEILQVVDRGLQLIEKLVEAKYWEQSDLAALVTVADMYKDTPGVKERATSVMQKVFTVEQLNICLETLRNDPPKSEARRTALKMLSPMSYVPQFADSVVAAKGIPLLVQAMEECSREIQVSGINNDLLGSLTGACKMLGNIANNPGYRTELADAGALHAAAEAAGLVANNPDAVAATLTLIAPMVKQEESAEELLASGQFEKILACLKQHPTSSSLIVGVARVIFELCALPSCCEYVAETEAPLIAITIAKTSSANLVSYYTALARMIQGLSSAETIANADLINSLSAISKERAFEAPVVKSICAMMAEASKLPDAKEKLVPLGAAELVIQCLAETTIGSEVYELALTALTNLATPETLARVLSRVKSSMAETPMNAAKCRTSLVALSVLASIKSLEPQLEAQHVQAEMLQHAKAIVDRATFAGSEECVSAALRVYVCIENLKPAPSAAAVKQLLEFARSPAVAKNSSKDPDMRILSEILAMSSNLTKGLRGDKAETVDLINGVLELMKKYAENRRALTACITMLAGFGRANHGEGSQDLLDCNAHQAVIAACRRVRMWEDVQVASFTCLDVILTNCGEPAAVLMRNAGGIDAVRGAQAAHARSEKLKRPLASVAAKLMPAGFVEDQMKTAMKALLRDTEAGHYSRARDTLIDLSGTVSTSEGARVGARIGLVGTVTAVMDRVTSISEHDLKHETAQYATRMAKDLTQTQTGAKNGVKSGLTEGLLTVINMSVNEDPVLFKRTIADALNSIANMAKLSPAECSEPVMQCSSVFINFARANAADETCVNAVMKVFASCDKKLVSEDAKFRDFIQNTLLADLQSTNCETSRKAARALYVLARDPAKAAMLLELGADTMAFDALARNASDPQVGDFLNLLEALTGAAPTLNAATKESLVPRLAVLSGIIAENPDPENCATCFHIIANLVDANPDPALWANNPYLRKAVKDAGTRCKASADLTDHTGKILSVIAGDDVSLTLIEQIVDVATRKEDRYEYHLTELTEELAMYMQRKQKNPKAIFSQMDRLGAALQGAVTDKPGHLSLTASVFSLAKTIAQSAAATYNQRDAAPAHAAVVTHILPSAVAVLSQSNDQQGQLVKQGSCVTNAYDLMTALLSSPQTRRAGLDAVKDAKLVKTAMEALSRDDLDDDMTNAIQRFLAAVAQDNEGYVILANQQAGSNKDAKSLFNKYAGMALDCGDATSFNSQRIRTSRNGLCMIAAFLQASPELRKQMLGAEDFLAALDALANQTLWDTLVVAQIQAGLIQGMGAQEANLMVKSTMDTLRQQLATTELTDADVRQVVSELIKVMEGCGKDENARNVFKKCGYYEMLGELLSITGGTAAQWRQMLAPLSRLCLPNEDVSSRVAKVVVPVMIENSAVLRKDPELKEEVLQMLLALGSHPGNAFAVSHTSQYAEFAKVLEAGVKEESELGLMLQSWKSKISSDQPRELTLEKVLAIWEEEKANGIKLTPLESPAVAEHIDFVLLQTATYCDMCVKNIEDGTGKELQAGCKCLALLHAHEENCEVCIEREEEAALVTGLRTQKAADAVQWVVDAAVAATTHEFIAKQLCFVPRVKEALIGALAKGRETSKEKERKEEMNLNRLTLLRQVVPDRKWLNGTSAMSTFIDYWDDSDRGEYTHELLRLVFRCMRISVNEEWTAVMIDRRVPQRLTDIINDKGSELSLLPDVLFLVGSLSSVPQLKLAMYQLGTVKAIVEFIQREMKNVHSTERPAAPSVINGLLALGNLCVSDTNNTKQFSDCKGLELSVDMMTEALHEGNMQYDLANAAAVVLCNVSFRRDDLKKEYARCKAPKAVMQVISNYDGRRDEAAFRCLSSMFKAIGNLSLYTPNVQDFAQGGISEVMSRFFEHSQEMPDALIETACRCLTNLAMENDVDLMEKLGAVSKPLLKTLDDRSHVQSHEMFAFALEAVASFARFEPNVKKMLDEEMVKLCVRIAASNQTRKVLSASIGVVAVAALQPSCIPTILDQGGLGLLVQAMSNELNEEAASDDTCTQIFVCTRRLCVDAAAAKLFLNADGLKTLIDLLKLLTEKPNAVLEGIRIILALLSLFPPPPAEKSVAADPGWEDEPVGNEGFLPIVYAISRPRGPRAWENIGLDASMANSLIMVVCQTCSSDSTWKLRRFLKAAIGLLGYLSCEKIRDTQEAYFAGDFFGVIVPILDNSSSDVEMVDIVSLIVANVGSVCEAESLEILKKKEDLKNGLSRAEKALPKSCPKPTRSIILQTIDLLHTREALQKDFAALAAWTFDLDRTAWNKDKYPNGVQDLPLDIKDGLRTGGVVSILTEESPKGDVHLWHASQDLSRFMWNRGKTPPAGNYANSTPIHRFSAITSGMGSIGRQNKSRKRTIASEANFMTLIGGSGGEGRPQELTLRFKSRSERDKIFEWMKEWREAAAFTF